MTRDERGFILTGLSFLLILPAMILSATYLSIVGMGGKTTSLQATSDKVFYVGEDVTRNIRYSYWRGTKLSPLTLNAFERSYEASTGLKVEIKRTNNIVRIFVYDPLISAKYIAIENLAKI